MQLGKKFYSVSETGRLLSLSTKDLVPLFKDGELRSERLVTAESIQDYATRKSIKIGTEAKS